MKSYKTKFLCRRFNIICRKNCWNDSYSALSAAFYCRNIFSRYPSDSYSRYADGNTDLTELFRSYSYCIFFGRRRKNSSDSDIICSGFFSKSSLLNGFSCCTDYEIRSCKSSYFGNRSIFYSNMNGGRLLQRSRASPFTADGKASSAAVR